MRIFPLLPLLLLAVRAGAYEHIVSLAPSATKSLYQLGLESRVIGITMYCPKGSTKKAVIGNVLEPDIEKIITLKPDLAVVSKEGNRQQTADQLRRAGIRVYIMDAVNSFSEICREFTKLGEFTGQRAEAVKSVESARRRIAALEARRGRGAKPSVFWEVGSQPLFTVSGKTFVNDFIELGGGVNIFRSAGPRYPQISREEVLRLDPDVIVMVTMGDVTDKEKSEWSRFPSMKAVRNGRIYVLHDAVFTDPTPEGIASGAEKVERLLHE